MVTQLRDSVQNGYHRDAENNKAKIQLENASIVGPLDRLVNQFYDYKQQQEIQEKKRRRREWITIIGLFFTAFLALVQAVIFYCTMQDARTVANQQAKDTATSLVLSGKAADAAARAVETNIAAERARLIVTNASTIRNAETDPNPKITFQIVNLGKTAAFITELSYECAIVWNNPNSINPNYNPERKHSAGFAITAGNVYAVPLGLECVLDTPITVEDFKELEAKNKILLFKGYVTYQDSFGDQFTKKFMFYSFYSKDGLFFPSTHLDSYNVETRDH